MILEIKDLRVSFLGFDDGQTKRFEAVDGLSAEIEVGSFTSLVGQSGSGKSVTALSVCKLVNPYRLLGGIYLHRPGGEKIDLLRLEGEALRAVRGHEIGYVFQDPASSLNPVLTAGFQIEEAYLTHFPETRAQARSKTLEALHAVKLNDAERVYRSYPHQLSGGMKQRVMIAMALVCGPRLLIADEPTTALDVMTERDILSLLTGLRKDRGLTLLFITHNLSLAMRHSDRIYVMEKGRVRERLEKTDNFAFREAYTKKLFNAELTNAKPKTLIDV